MSKISRNQPCPCGSGKKYKRCHGALNEAGDDTALLRIPKRHLPPEFVEKIDLHLKVHEANEIRRKDSQGLGKGIISTEFKGHRFTGVGSKLLITPDSKSFHNFLSQYLTNLLADWIATQRNIPDNEQHEILHWLRALEHNTKLLKEQGIDISQGVPIIGASRAWLELAYDMYSLEHNAEIRATLLKRLLHSDQFRGALTEIRVAGILIRAGFGLEFENEDDNTTTHCEYTATCVLSGKKYSVEVKHRELSSQKLRVGQLLNAALRKEAKHQRLIFIDFFRDVSDSEASALDFVNRVSSKIRERERDTPNKQAYIIFTSTPHLDNLYGPAKPAPFAPDSYNLESFRPGCEFHGYRAAYRAKQDHIDILNLLDSIQTHSKIPLNFDEDIHDKDSQLVIGQDYLFDQYDVPGRVVDALVDERNKESIIVVNFKNGRSEILKKPLSDKEMEAYRAHPDTFFGIYKKASRTANTPLELFEFFLESLTNATRDQVLKQLETAADFEQLNTLTDTDLREILAERYTIGAQRAKNAPPNKLS